MDELISSGVLWSSAFLAWFRLPEFHWRTIKFLQLACFGSARGAPTQKPEWVAILALEYFPLDKSVADTLLGLFLEL